MVLTYLARGERVPASLWADYVAASKAAGR